MASTSGYSYTFDRALRKSSGPIPAVSLYLARPYAWRVLSLTQIPCQFFGIVFTAAVVVFLVPFHYLTVIVVELLCYLIPRLEALEFTEPFDLVFHTCVKVCLKVPPLWGLFWQLYFQFGIMDDACSNYTEMWRQHFRAADNNTEPLSLIMFLDNGMPMEVPCSQAMNDKAFIQHIATFYYLQKIRKGVLEALGFRTLAAIEVVELHGDAAVGRRDTVLALGRYDGNRLIYYFRHPDEIKGDKIFTSVKDSQVLTASGAGSPEKLWALNFVSTWHTNFAGLAVIAPIALSTAVSVAWPVMAVLKYELDVQASVQTGFTIGSYVVTAGGLLIALITFTAAAYDNNAKYTEVLRGAAARA